MRWLNLARLYLDKVHGLPDLDLQLDIDGKNITAKIYSANDYGGSFGYPAGIEYTISAGGQGFTVNTESFSYSSSGQLIAQNSGTVGNGDLKVYTTCYGSDSEGCFGINEPYYPQLNTSKSQGINPSEVTVYGISQNYTINHVTDTLLMVWTGFSVISPSFSSFTGDYIENQMKASINLGTGTFQSFAVKPKSTQTGSTIASYSKNYSSWTFTDTELLTIYQGCSGGSGEQQIYLELTVTTSDGFATATYSIKIGGTSWTHNGAWKRTVPYIRGLNKKLFS